MGYWEVHFTKESGIKTIQDERVNVVEFKEGLVRLVERRDIRYFETLKKELTWYGKPLKPKIIPATKDTTLYIFAEAYLLFLKWVK